MTSHEACVTYVSEMEAFVSPCPSGGVSRTEPEVGTGIPENRKSIVVSVTKVRGNHCAHRQPTG